jgi:hypothetical protein
MDSLIQLASVHFDIKRVVGPSRIRIPKAITQVG